jgi:hypothetical protein
VLRYRRLCFFWIFFFLRRDERGRRTSRVGVWASGARRLLPLIPLPAPAPSLCFVSQAHLRVLLFLFAPQDCVAPGDPRTLARKRSVSRQKETDSQVRPPSSSPRPPLSLSPWLSLLAPSAQTSQQDAAVPRARFRLRQPANMQDNGKLGASSSAAAPPLPPPPFAASPAPTYAAAGAPPPPMMPVAGGMPPGPPPPGAPYYPQQQAPPHQYAYGQPVPGMGGPPPPMGVAGGPVPVYIAGAPQQPTHHVYGDPTKKCQCTIGWVLFGVGWIFPFLWFPGTFVFCCTKNVHDRRAAVANGVMSLLFLAAIVTVIVLTAVGASQGGGYYYGAPPSSYYVG